MLPGRQPAGALGLSLPVDGNLGLYVMLHRAALIIKGTLVPPASHLIGDEALRECEGHYVTPQIGQMWLCIASLRGVIDRWALPRTAQAILRRPRRKFRV
jgi:hypothetical protein